MSNNGQSGAGRALQLYYAATVAFLVLDAGFGINVRIAALDGFPGARAAYYLVIFCCFGLMLWQPAWSAVIGCIESLATLVMLIVGMALRSMIVTDRMLETGTGLVTAPEVVNFVISGSIAWFAWQRSLRQLLGR